MTRPDSDDREAAPPPAGRSADDGPTATEGSDPRAGEAGADPTPAGSADVTPAADPLLDPATSKKLDDIYGLLTLRRGAELTDLVQFLRSKRHLAWANFVLGMSRGVGFFLGFSLVGAVVVAVVGYFVDFTARTFQSSYDTQTIVRTVMNKYVEVMDEVDRARADHEEAVAWMPSATGAEVGAAFRLAAREPGSPTTGPPERGQ